MPDGAQIMAEYQYVRTHYSNFLTRWDAQAPFLAPSRIGIQTKFTPGVDQMGDVYDSTTLGAADFLSKFLWSSSCPPGSRWGRTTAKKYDLGERDEVDDWCDEVTTKILKALAASNFYAEGGEMTVDLTAFGTGSILCEERKEYATEYEGKRGGFRGLRFQTDKTGRFFNGVNAEGVIDKEFRECQYSARAANDRWGKKGNLPDAIKDLLKDGGTKQEQLFTFIHAVYPRPKAERGKQGAKGYDWTSCWVEKQTKQLVYESGYKSYPFCNPRWEVTPGEIPGRGPGDRAFPDTKTLNTAKKMGFEDWALKIRPPILQGSDAVIGNIRMKPAGPTTVKLKGSQSVKDVVAPWETGSHPEVSQIKEEELRRSINELFFVDILRNLLKVEKSEMTAFEFQQKLMLMYRILGSVYGRYEAEFLSRLWDIVFSIMWDAKALPPPPDAMFDQVKEISVEFTSPLALAQNSSEIDGIVQTYSVIPVLALQDAQRAIDLKDNLDDDKALRFISKSRAIPEGIIRSEKDRDKIRQARVEAKNQQTQADQMTQASEAAKNVAPLIKSLQQPTGNA